MTSPNHIGTGICLTLLAGTGLYDSQKIVNNDIYTNILNGIHVNDIANHTVVTNLPFWIAVICLMPFCFILPDIDSERSWITKFCKRTIILAWIPLIFNNFKHHYWTHTAYFSITLCVLGYFTNIPLLYYLGFGYFIHLFVDSFGTKGTCFFIPRYRKYPNGGEIKVGHKIKLYHTERLSEYICAGVIYAGTLVWGITRFIY